MRPAKSVRVSQRQPTACQECSRRKIRCDKQSPCSRCTRLSKTCTRELVHITKAFSAHRDELQFLQALLGELRTAANVDGAVSNICRRIDQLEHGPKTASPSGTKNNAPAPGPSQAATPTPVPAAGGSLAVDVDDDDDAPATLALVGKVTNGEGDADVRPSAADIGVGEYDANQAQSPSMFQDVELLAWGRRVTDCYPHRDCSCPLVRSYAELASINADPRWPALQGFQVTLPPAARLPVGQARHLMRFHMDYVFWHHNAFHTSTFLAQCERFWASGTVCHPLWAALYLSVTSVSLWTALNAESPSASSDVTEGAARAHFQAMLQTLYDCNFLQQLSLFSIQAVVISTRVAHNLGYSDLNATMVSACIRIAHCLGIHKIGPDHDRQAGDVPVADWYKTLEAEVGHRCWAQLVIQDHFQMPFTDTYMIHPWHYKTELPSNRNDDDMVIRDGNVATKSSYVRTLARIASLMPPLLDGLGPIRKRRPLSSIYKHILATDEALRHLVRTSPPFLLHQSPHDDQSHVWLPLARKSLAITVADKIILIHRPVLLQSFQSSQFQRTRQTCVAAAMTILREHGALAGGVSVSIWTHSAFCVTAAMVVGLELLYRSNHTDAEAQNLRQAMLKTSARLRSRNCDVIAERGAVLIDTILATEEELVVKIMRTEFSTSTIRELQQDVIDGMIKSHQLMARFLVLSSDDYSFGEPSSANFHNDGPDGSLDQGGGHECYNLSEVDVDSWFSDIFYADGNYGVPENL
ncbi:hypothetical protein V2G26_012735 [Clonostachys chloroleuca]